MRVSLASPSQLVAGVAPSQAKLPRGLRRRSSVRTRVSRQLGFSLTELVVTLAIALVLMAVGLPAFLRAYRFYQLNAAATQMADMLRYTRYEAIRLNKPVACVIQPYSGDPTMTNVFIDPNGTGVQQSTAKVILLNSSGNLVAASSVPAAGGLPSAANLGAAVPAAPSPSGATIQFDTRGAVTTGNINAFYLNSPVSPDAGYRAILLMPAGSTQIWTTDASGVWQQVR
jgi:prepilin-type N-terminal cleavage/methylation domain-containing protein